MFVDIAMLVENQVTEPWWKDAGKIAKKIKRALVSEKITSQGNEMIDPCKETGKGEDNEYISYQSTSRSCHIASAPDPSFSLLLGKTTTAKIQLALSFSDEAKYEYRKQCVFPKQG